MKLREVSTGLILVICASLLVGAFIYFSKEKNQIANDIKSKMTSGPEATSPALKLKEIIAKNLEKKDEMVERVDFAPIVTNERFYTESEISEMSEEKFIELLKDIELKMPKISDFKKLPPGALHRTPAPVIEAGKDLGLIKEILAVHEAYERNAVAFYDRCADNKERPTAVRALCLTNLIILKKKNGEAINLKRFPPDLVDLTRMITDNI